MDKHTPGPWSINQEYGDEILSPYGKTLAEVHGARFVGDMADPQYEIPAEVAANTRLIAAAPELLDALQRLLSNDGISNRDFARAVIQKATQSQPTKENT